MCVCVCALVRQSIVLALVLSRHENALQDGPFHTVCVCVCVCAHACVCACVSIGLSQSLSLATFLSICVSLFCVHVCTRGVCNTLPGVEC
jgi:uncharacterized membrane protein YGL010W